MNKNIILYAAILIFGVAAPFVFPAFKVQLSILCVLIVLALTIFKQMYLYGSGTDLLSKIEFI